MEEMKMEDKKQLVVDDDPMMDSWFRTLKSKMECMRIRNELARKFIAEYLGTFILVMFHNGSIAQNILSGGSSVHVSWGATVGLMMGIYWSCNISGGHINPAISLGFALIGKLPMRHFPVYALAQTLGAFTAAVMIYGVYADAINSIDGGTRQVLGPEGTAGMFAAYPQIYLTLPEGFFDQLIGTALLMSCILAVTDSRNSKPIKGMEPFVIGFILHGVSDAYGLNYGYPVNPAKDFAPRVFSAMLQYGSDVWVTFDAHWWWVGIVGPFAGGPIGAWIYYWLIEFQHPPMEATPMEATPMEVMTMPKAAVSEQNGESNEGYTTETPTENAV